MNNLPVALPGTGSPTQTRSHQGIVKWYLGICLLVYLLMMLVGIIMRTTQGASLHTVEATLFYQLMTLHGAGMVGVAGLSALAVNWYFLSRHVRLDVRVMAAALIVSLIAVVMIIGSILLGGFAAGWTFLYPLPAHTLGIWSTTAAVVFTLGLLLLGVAFLLVYADMGLAITRRCGSLARGLGLQYLFGREPVDESHSPTLVASSMVIIANGIGIAAGAVVLILTLANLLFPAVAPDALLMKHLIYFFGHVFINATIYSAVTAVYEILPEYARRPWKISRPFLAAWFAASFMVLAVYPHHLLMDFAIPPWAAITGQIVSYTSGIPVLVVTAFGGLLLIYRSGIQWDRTSALLLLSLFGWAAGVIPAVIDGIIRVNLLMHNTLWVPGHFHFYLTLGLLPMIFGFATYLIRDTGQPPASTLPVKLYLGGGLLLSLSFLVSGALSVPRRFAVHEDSWQWLANVGAVAGVLLLLSTLMIVTPVLLRLPRGPGAHAG